MHLTGECQACGGKGCAACFMTGQQTVTQCPMSLLDSESQGVMRMARYAERGVLPRTGALLEQREWDAFAIEFVWAEQARALNERYDSDE
jgi:hypothetical protein